MTHLYVTCTPPFIYATWLICALHKVLDALLKGHHRVLASIAKHTAADAERTNSEMQYVRDMAAGGCSVMVQFLKSQRAIKCTIYNTYRADFGEFLKGHVKRRLRTYCWYARSPSSPPALSTKCQCAGVSHRGSFFFGSFGICWSLMRSFMCSLMRPWGCVSRAFLDVLLIRCVLLCAHRRSALTRRRRAPLGLPFLLCGVVSGV